MPKRSGAQTRDLMLRAAVEIIQERATTAGDDVVPAALAHLRLTQVAERATSLVRAETGDLQATAITTGAIYQLWPSQPDFQADVLFHIAELRAGLFPSLGESLDRFTDARAHGVPVEDVLCRTLEQAFQQTRADPLFRVQLSFLISAADPRVKAALAHLQATFDAAADQAWQGMIDAYDLRMRPPFRVRDLTTAVAAQISGSATIWFADADGLADPHQEEGWSLTSRAILAIFRGFTQPNGDA